jgi:hypothetical protein
MENQNREERTQRVPQKKKNGGDMLKTVDKDDGLRKRGKEGREVITREKKLNRRKELIEMRDEMR